MKDLVQLIGFMCLFGAVIMMTPGRGFAYRLVIGLLLSVFVIVAMRVGLE